MRSAAAGVAQFVLFGGAMLAMYGVLDTWPLAAFLGLAFAMAAAPSQLAQRRRP